MQPKRLLSATITALLLFPCVAVAQLNGQYPPGFVGLKSGTQPPPGFYISVPIWLYSADELKNRNGDVVLTGHLHSSLYTVVFNAVTKKKLLGGNYGFMAMTSVANNRVETTVVFDFSQDTGVGLSDSYVQPINLGWHPPRADFLVAYGLYIPTGRYEPGASNNTGLGMWAQEIDLGTTVYMNKGRSIHASTTAAFDFQSDKKDSTTKVGDILNLEGGVGADFLGGGITTGLAYFAVIKLTDDHFENPIVGALVRGKDRVWGLGPAYTMAIPVNKKVYGFVTVQYQWELGARTTTQGSVWNIQLTFPTKPIPIK